jgi:hypothetical protein
VDVLLAGRDARERRDRRRKNGVKIACN